MPEEPRLDVAASCNASRHGRELQRVEDQESLTDRCIQRVGRRPVGPFEEALGLVETPVLPRAVGNRAIALADHRKIEFLPKPKLAGHHRYLVVSDPMTHCVEVGVAALRNRSVHVDRAMAAEAAEEAIPEPVAAGTMDPLRWIDAMLKKRQRVHRLDRRSWRVERVEYLVEQRPARVLGQHLPLRPSNAVRETVRIVGRHRHHREDVARHGSRG